MPISIMTRARKAGKSLKVLSLGLGNYTEA
jgi:hypothetical protein